MVEPARFRQQIRALRRRGYRFIRLSEFVACLEEGRPPDRACVLTFDDGTVDNLEVVAPLLAEFGVPATFFVCPGLLGAPHFGFPAQAGVRMMRADELRELASSPLAEIGSHTNTHADLSSVSEEEAYQEMASSKDALEELLQLPIHSFAYPRCSYSPACPEAARRAGYKVAVTCAGLGGWRQFELARESIDSLDRRLGFALKSRRLFWPLRESPPGKLARAAVRPLRHG
jgi:peptidoglycan/xylan/chitin deacetylase (PgdA/CDA1 family)